jgi:hypothetical protein
MVSESFHPVHVSRQTREEAVELEPR